MSGFATTSASLSRFAFWPESQYAIVAGQRVYRWNFYWLDPHSLVGCPCQYELAMPDESAVGSTLERIFSRIGFRTRQNCDCGWIKEMLDDAPISFVDEHKLRIANLISDSAAKQKVFTPAAAVVPFISLAIRFH